MPKYRKMMTKNNVNHWLGINISYDELEIKKTLNGSGIFYLNLLRMVKETKVAFQEMEDEIIDTLINMREDDD